MKTTIEDIAQEVGCSKATVSSILTGSGTSARFGAEIRKKVLSIATKLNYRPLSTHSLGFVYFAGPVDHTKVDWVNWISPMLTSAHEEALLHDKSLSIFGYSSTGLQSEFDGGKPPQVFRRRKIDGMVISGRLDDNMLAHFAESRMPHILMNISDADAHSVDSVCFDEIFTGMQATRYLLEKGHRRILHASVNWSPGHYSIAMRQRGYEMAMKDAGAEPRILSLVGHEHDRFAARLAATLRGPNPPTAIFTFDEPVAILCYRVLRELGIGVSDVALISSAWGHRTAMEHLQISHVELPAAEMGRLAVQMLIRKLTTNAPIPTVSLRGVIREMGSTSINQV